MKKKYNNCSVDDCNNRAVLKGMCQKHYRRILRNGTLEVKRIYKAKPDKLCSIKGCDGVHYGKGLCSLHYARLKRTGSPFIVYPKGRGKKIIQTELKQIVTKTNWVN